MVKSILFQPNDQVPNNPSLPVLLYEGVWKDCPREAEALLNKNGWLNSWKWSVYPYHHYHTNTHEVLAVTKGRAELMLGGETGKKISVSTGDVIVLPAGTGHKLLLGTEDFEVAGAYPAGLSPNLFKTGENIAEKLSDIQQVSLPERDPVTGGHGPLLEWWK
ncbi:cupin domain-containing protein [Metabacillus sp. GX 13764]|uniref:cupin domain-containing protein n=1 Tax=Metabacillus kandeliae TaxID=2900151 RepID=UPI001E37DCB0|nr:cupin domain-containing protein [Metabacillus kandeliae]MCD7033991.1 cupin domain-containing protein [Metabacillus kandeliae]